MTVAAMSDTAPPPGYRANAALIERVLFHGSGGDVGVYALIDGEWCEGLFEQFVIHDDLAWEGLWRGSLAQERSQNAPFIVALEPGHVFTRWLIDTHWGKGCVCWLMASHEAMSERYGRPPEAEDEADADRPAMPEADAMPAAMLARHFRKFTLAEFETDGRIVDFRFYDPAILRLWLTSCTDRELAAFFGPVLAFAVERFSAVETLNRPNEIHQYWLRRPSDDAAPAARAVTALETRIVDLIGGRRRSGEPCPRPPEPARRPVNANVLIRADQMARFEAMEMEAFTEKTVTYIADNPQLAGNDLSRDELRGFVGDQFTAARRYGLTTEINLLNFAVAAFREKGDLRTNPRARNYLARIRTRGELMHDPEIERWADHGLPI